MKNTDEMTQKMLHTIETVIIERFAKEAEVDFDTMVKWIKKDHDLKVFYTGVRSKMIKGLANDVDNIAEKVVEMMPSVGFANE